MYDTTNQLLKVWNGSASTAIDTSLQTAAQDFIERGVNKGMGWLGPGNANSTYADGNLVGAGFEIVEVSTAAMTTNDAGGWLHTTGTTNSSTTGFNGAGLVAANDWTLVWRGSIPSAANQTVSIGATSVGVFGDNNNRIAFRVSGTGNVIGVCDNGASETTRDTGADGSTEMTLRIEVREGGTIVRFYKNDVQVGAEVTDNIYTSALDIAVGITNANSANVNMTTYDATYWREV
jgi:hypothetical protein